MPGLRLADRATDRASRTARRGERRDREHASAFRGRHRRQLRHRMRSAAFSADGEAMVYHDDALGPADRWRRRASRSHGRGYLKTRRVPEHGRPHDDAWRTLRPGRRPRHAGDRDSRADSTATRAWPRAPREVLQRYAGPVAAMSFDPVMVVGAARTSRRACRAGWSPKAARHPEWTRLSAGKPWRYLLRGCCARGRISSPMVVQRPAGGRAAVRRASCSGCRC